MATAAPPTLGATGLRGWLRDLALIAAPLALVAAAPRALTLAPADHLWVHTVMETLAVVVALAIAGLGWATRHQRPVSAAAVAGPTFFAVGLLHLAHMLSYRGMPTWVTPSGPNKAIDFWLVARATAALGLLALSRRSPRAPSWVLYGVAALVVIATSVAVLGFLPHLPVMFVPGRGLTATKVACELAVACAALAAAIRLRGSAAGDATLGRAALLLTGSGVPFVLYTSVSDAFNLLGHGYMLLGYLLVYRAVFIETVRAPYARLAASLAAQRASESRLADFAAHVPEVFWIADPATGALRYVSPGARAVLGVEPAALTTLDALLATYHPDDRAAAAAAVAAVGDGHRPVLAGRIQRPDGTSRQVQLAVFALGDRGETAGVISDVTEQHDAAAAMARAERMEAVGRLAGGIAHDFNNLLVVVFSSVDLAREDLPADHPTQADLVAIREAGGRARELTTQLLALARRHPGEARRIDAGRLVSRTVAMARPALGSSLELAVTVEPGVHPVRIDPTQLEQVVLNLLINARDAIAGSGRIGVSVARVGARIRLVVEDDGAGMAPEVAARALEPFFTTKEPGKGTGMGLASCDGIVTQAGGTITIDSTVGRGTRMIVELPVDHGEVTDGDAASAASVRGGAEAILVVEDEPLVRAFTERVLAGHGYRVTVAANGADALAALEADAAPVDLVLSDVVMPRMGGVELARRLAAVRPGLRVLLVTGYAPDVAAGPRFALLPKPYTADELLRRVREVLDQPPRAPEASSGVAAPPA